MKIGVIRLVPRDLFWGAVFVYAYGALLGSLWLGWLLVMGTPAFTASAEIGYWVASAGVLLGLVGVVLHWAKNWRAILRVRE